MEAEDEEAEEPVEQAENTMVEAQEKVDAEGANENSFLL